MSPSIVLEKCQILEFNVRPYTRKSDGAQVEFREVTFRLDGKLLKLSCNKDVSLADKIDKSVNLVVDLTTFGDSLTPTLRISGVGSAKA